MPIIDVGDVRLEYSLTGPANRPVIAFVHGLSGNMHQFLDQQEFFSRNYRVLLLSLRGHGGSSYPQPANRETFALESMAKDVVSLLDRIDVPAVHWVGNSMGGLVGFQVLKDYPERLQSLAVFGITARQHYSPILVTVLTLIKDLLIKLKGYEGFCRMAGPISSKYPETQGKVVEMAQSASQEAVRYGHMHVVSVDFLSVLAEAELPLLLIKAEYDRAINKALKSTLELYETSANAEIKAMQGVGHYANLDSPAEFNNILDDWYSRILSESDQAPWLLPATGNVRRKQPRKR